MFRRINAISTYIYIILVQVGNQAFANYIDANVNVTRINNKSASKYFIYLDLMNLIFLFFCRKDFVPIIPGMQKTALTV